MKRTISIRVTDEEYDQLCINASKSGMNVSNYSHNCLFDYLNSDNTVVKAKFVKEVSTMCNIVNKMENFIYDNGIDTYKELRKEVYNLWNMF